LLTKGQRANLSRRDFCYRVFLEAWLYNNGNAKLEQIVLETTSRGITRDEAFSAAERAKDKFMAELPDQQQGRTYHVRSGWRASQAFHKALDELVREREGNESYHEETPPEDVALERAMKLVAYRDGGATEVSLLELVARVLGPDADDSKTEQVMERLAKNCEVREARY
jgi:hypothetical protein